jgi:hypothetical protein
MAVTAPVSGARGATEARAALGSGETTLRLIGSALIAFAIAVFVVGAAWDIQWHPSVGRDRVLSSPHIVLLSGIALSGLLSLFLILLDSWRAWRGRGVSDSNSTTILGVFRAPIGLFASGVGALTATLAFPLDDYWHTLYGIDVTLWAPFHIMIISSMVLVGVGALYTIASEMNRLPAGRAKIAAQFMFAAALAMALAALLLPLPQANGKEGLGQFGAYQFAIYPVLVAIALPLALVSATRVTKLHGATTIMALVFLALQLALYQIIPAAMRVSVADEGLSYRAGAPNVTITPYSYPHALLVAALAIDAVAWLTRRAGLAGQRAVLGAAALASVLVTLWDRPWTSYMPHYYFGIDTTTLLINALPLAIVAALLGAGAAAVFSRSLEATQQ